MARELRPHERQVPPVHIDTERLAKMLAEHMYHLEHMIKGMQRDIPKIVDEFLYMQNATSLILSPQSQNLEMITGVFAVVTSAGGGTLTLGSGGRLRTIPVPQGNTFFPVGSDVAGMILNNGDPRQLTQNVAGLLGLELFGLELPDKGAF